MGCRHCFVVDRLEELVDEGDSRSSPRAHEHGSSRLVFTTACGNPHTLKSMSTSSNGVDEPKKCPITTGLPFYHDLHLRFCLCLCLSLNVQQTNWYSCTHERNVYRFPEHSNGTIVLSQLVSPFYHDLD